MSGNAIGPAAGATWRARARRSAAELRDACAAEWTKFRTAPGGWGLLAALVVLTLALGAGADAAVGTSAGPGRDPVRTSLTGVALGQAAAAALAVTLISGEYATGMIRTTLAAMPRREVVLAAKAAVLSTAVLAAGTVAVGASLLAGRLLLPGRDASAIDLADPATRRAAIGSVLYLALVALLAFGVGTAVRDPGVATGGVLALLYLFPVVAAVVSDEGWQRHLRQAGPMSAGLAVQATTATSLQGLALSPWQGLGVLAAWSAAALLLATALFHHRTP